MFSFCRKIFFTFLMVLFGFDAQVFANSPGEFDLRRHSFAKDGPVILGDQWQVYWGKLLDPEELDKHKADEVRAFVNIIPDSLKEKFPDDPSKGKYATFRTKVYLPEQGGNYSLFIPELRSAAKVWINGELHAEIGQVAVNSEEEVHRIRPLLIDLDLDNFAFDIHVQVSSFSNIELGSTIGMQLGYSRDIHAEKRSAMVRDSFAIGAILIMGFYHLALFLLRRDRYAPLWFGLFCIMVAIRAVVRSDGLLIYQIFENPYTPLIFRLEFLGFSLPSAVMTHYVYMLYPKDIPYRVSRVVLAACLFYSGLIILTPMIVYIQILVAFQITILTFSAYYIYCLGKAVYHRRNGSILFLTGFLAIVGGTLNDILKHHGVLETPTLNHVGLFCFTLLQSIILSKRFSRAFARLEEAEHEIRHLNDGLEQIVQERTETIQVILDNVKSGFLLVDAEIKIKKGFTQSCLDIFAQDLQEGQDFLDLFDLGKRQKEHLQLAMKQAFDDRLPEIVTLSQIQKRLPVIGRQIMIQAAVVRDRQKRVQALLITLNDVTHLAQVEEQANLSKILLKIVKERKNFATVIREALLDISKMRVSVIKNKQDEIPWMLHTLKGNFASFGLEDLATWIHALEDKENITIADLEDLDQQIHQFLEQNRDVLQIDPGMVHHKSYAISEAQFEQLFHALEEQGASRELMNVCQQWLDDRKMVRFDSLVSSLHESVKRIGSQLGKEVDLRLEGGSLLIDPDRLETVIHNLIHLIRNSIDHGIEYPEERGEKPGCGLIHIKVWREYEQIYLQLSDDGQGIDAQKILLHAWNKGLITEDQKNKLSEEEILQLIFQPGFSTRPKATAISGRGVGMSAIKQCVLDLGGEIRIQTDLGQGTRFVLVLPEYHAMKDAALSA
ncbi:MAG: 7TM diverse intracellular signaling domain-containing protein [Oligoflexus sp.]